MDVPTRPFGLGEPFNAAPGSTYQMPKRKARPVTVSAPQKIRGQLSRVFAPSGARGRARRDPQIAPPPAFAEGFMRYHTPDRTLGPI